MNRRERRGQAKRGGRTPDKAEAARQAFRRADGHFRAGEFGRAQQLYNEILAADPRHAASLHQLGAIALAEGRLEAAAALFGRAIALDDGIPEAHSNLAIVLHKQGDGEAAAQSALRAVALRPGDAEAHNTAGLALQQMDRHEEALAHFRKAVALARRSHFRKNQSLSLRALGRNDEAVAALGDAPQSAERNCDLANLLLSVGRIEAARAALRRALALDPRHAGSWYFLSAAGGMTAEERARLEQLAGAAGLTPEAQVDIEFALAKALTDAGEKARGFVHYLAGNRIKRGLVAYDEDAARDELSRAAETVTAPFLARHRGAGEPSALPCFILGMPRSGTSLVEQILASHPSVHAAGERGDFAQAVRRHLGSATAWPEALDGLTGETLGALGRGYLAALRRIQPGAARITDKMPSNFRFAGLIHAALPEARIIHVRRDAVDTCLACFTQAFHQPQPFSYELGELGRYWKAYDRLMAHWRAVLPEGVMLELRYEELVADFEAQARRLIAHCGLEWDPACLEFHKTERAVTTSSWVQVRQPVYATSVGRWRPDAAVLKPLLDALAD